MAIKVGIRSLSSIGHFGLSAAVSRFATSLQIGSDPTNRFGPFRTLATLTNSAVQLPRSRRWSWLRDIRWTYASSALQSGHRL